MLEFFFLIIQYHTSQIIKSLATLWTYVCAFDNYRFYLDWCNVETCFDALMNYVYSATNCKCISAPYFSFYSKMIVFFMVLCSIKICTFICLVKTSHFIFNAYLLNWICDSIHSTARYFTFSGKNFQKFILWAGRENKKHLMIFLWIAS